MIQNLDWKTWQQIPRLSMKIVEAGYQRYQVHLQTQPDKKAIARLTTLSADLRDKAMRASRKPYTEPDVRSLQECAWQLYASFFPRPVRAELEEALVAYRGERDFAADQPAPMRLRLDIRDPLLHYLPWEFVQNPRGEVGSSQAPLIVSRYTPRARPAEPLPFSGPVKILVIVASTAIKGGIHPPYEMEALTAGMGVALVSGRLELEMVENPIREELAKELARRRPHILHYIGHGFISRGTGHLALRQQMGSFSDFLSPAELGAMIPPGPLRLVGLQTPISATNYQLPAFAGFAAEVAAVKVGGICFSLLPDSARAFGELYAQLVEGMPVDLALQSSRSDCVPALVGFHQHAASSQILADLHHPEVRIAPSTKAIDSYQTTLKGVIEKARSEQGARAIRKAADVLLELLDSSQSQFVLTPGLREALDKHWQILERVTEEATGSPIDNYVDVPTWEWEEVRRGAHPPSESAYAKSVTQRIDEIAFVQDSLDSLFRKKQQYGDEAPGWLLREISSDEDRLTELVRRVRGGESDA